MRAILVRSLMKGAIFPGRQSLGDLYDRYADRWHRALARLGYHDAYRLLMRHPCIDDLRHTSGLRVLDVGTGTASLAIAFAEEVTRPERLDLLDPSTAMLREAVRNAEGAGMAAQPLQGGVGDGRIPAEGYDVLLCGHVIEHCDDPAAALSWMMGRLKPGGHLILSVSKPHICTWLVRWRWRHRAFRAEQIVGFLQDAGAQSVIQHRFPNGPPSRMSQGFVAKR